MTGLFKRVADSADFHRFILLLILLSGFGMGLEAVPALADQYGGLLYWMDIGIQTIFVIEISIRLLAYAPDIRRFFRDGWNVFDFTIVALSLLPFVGTFALVARLLRLVRVMRIMSETSFLRRFTDRLRESFDEIATAGMLVLLFGYIFTVTGYYLFSTIDIAHWGDLRHATISVFYLLLLQNVPAYAGPVTDRSLGYLLYFIAFYFVFIGLALATTVAAVLQREEVKK